jgi:hypothetical protein
MKSVCCSQERRPRVLDQYLTVQMVVLTIFFSLVQVFVCQCIELGEVEEESRLCGGGSKEGEEGEDHAEQSDDGNEEAARWEEVA